MSGPAVCPACGARVSAGDRFCASCGTALVGGTAAAEERKLATILFADVAGSTDLGEQLDPERLRALLADYFGAMTSVVTTWGGTVEKYIGDAILAVWGVPVAREDDPVRALHAALEMIAELDRLNPTFETRHGVRLGVRIGVNTGEVLVPVGARPGGQFLVSGDAVNVAARLQQAARPGTTLVGERTWSSARHAFEFEPGTSLAVKGKSEPITARSLGKPIATAAQRTPFQAPMIGRDRELATLVGLLDEAIESASPRLVVLSGPAGIGKSRMLREMIAEAGERFDKLLVLRGRCVAAGHGITFWALGEVLREACSISLDEPAESAAQKLQQSVAGPLAQLGLGIEEIAQTVGALATSANITLPDNPLGGQDPEQVFEQMSRAWPRFVTGLARAWPLAILIEDIHWADERMLSLLEMLASRSQGRILIAATARPEFVETHRGFGSGQDVTVVALRPLTSSQSGHLIDELIGSAGLPVAIVDDMRAKADGNPFFLEEMLQRLVDEGALIKEEGRWRATERASTVQLSDNVHSLLAARIDALPIDQKQFLQEAAVVGRIFWPGAVERHSSASTGASQIDTQEILRALERRGLVAVRPTSTIDDEPEYIFRHMLIHDVAYGSVPKARRARAHAEVAAWIEQLSAGRLDEFGELIAYHYSAAISADDADLAWSDRPAEREAVRGRAFEMLLRAGASARHRFAIDKALELHRDAARIATTDTEQWLVHEELGDDHEALFHGDEAVADYLIAIEHAQRLPNSEEAVGVLVAKTARMTVRWGAFRETPPIERIEALIEVSLASQVSDQVRAPLLIASAGLARGPNGSPIGTGRVLFSSLDMPDLEKRIDTIQEGLAIARRLEDPSLQYMAYDLLSIVFQSSRQEQRYREICEEALILLDRLPSRRQQVDMLVAVAGARADAGRYESALEAAEDAFRRSTDLSPHERMHAAWEIYRSSEPLGRWDRIEELLPWYSSAAAAEGDITCAAVRAGPSVGGTVVTRRGRPKEAMKLIPLASTTGSSGTFGGAAMAARYAATVAAEAGMHAEADPHAERIISEALKRTSSGFIATGTAPMIDALIELRRFDDLAAFLPIAREQTRTNGLVQPSIERAEAVLILSAAEVTDDARAEAKALLRASLEGFRALRVPFEVARTAEMLAGLASSEERDELLRVALDNYEDLMAAPSVAHVRDTLQSGVRP